MPSENIHVLVNRTILVLVEEIKECLETKFLIQDTQQDIIENAMVALKLQLN